MTSFAAPSSRSSGPRQHAAASVSGLCALCEQLTDRGLAATIFVVPWLLGGARSQAQLVMVVLALATAMAWLASRCLSRGPRWHWLGVEPLVLAGIALVWLQTVPLPADYLSRLSPHLQELTSLDDEERAASAWSTISLTPVATRLGFSHLTAYCLLFLVAAQRVREVADARRFLGWTACAAAAMAVFGLVQFVSGTDRYFWVIDIPEVPASEVVHGSFVNRNHLAQFLALGAGPLLMFALGTSPLPATRRFAARSGGAALPESSQMIRAAAWAGFVAVCLASILSLSRGGVLALATAVLVVLGVGYRGRLPGGRMLPGVLLLAGALVVALFLPWADGLEERVLDSVATTDLERIDKNGGRRRIWQAVAGGIADFPIAGAGVGSHPHVYPMYFDHPDERIEYSTAESGFLQLTLETGAAGLLLLCIGIAWIVSRSLNAAAQATTPEHSTCLAAALAGLAASIVHSAVETPWFMPGCMVLTIPLIACAVALSAPRSNTDQPRGFALPRPMWAAFVVGLGCAVPSLVNTGVAAVQGANGWSALMALEAANGESSQLAPAELKQRLDAISSLDIAQPGLQFRLAKEYLQAFEELQKSSANPMSLADLRQAALDAEFASTAELRDWLLRATSGNSDCLFTARRLLRSALRVAPLEGEAWCLLSELCFLDGEDDDARRRLLAQAARVRPYDPRVMFATGQIEWQSGNADLAFHHWQRAYHRSRVWERKITALLTGVLPAETFLSVFEPDWMALRDLRNLMVEPRHPEYDIVARRFAEAAAARARTVEVDGYKLLLDAHQAYLDVGDEAAALECAQAAAAAQRHSFPARIAAARLLLHAKRFSEAVPHLQWCLRRKPADEQVAGMLKFAMERHAQQMAPQQSSILAAGGLQTAAANSDRMLMHADVPAATRDDRADASQGEMADRAEVSQTLLRKESER